MPTWRISLCGGSPARSWRVSASGSQENFHRRSAGSRWLRMGSWCETMTRRSLTGESQPSEWRSPNSEIIPGAVTTRGRCGERGVVREEKSEDRETRSRRLSQDWDGIPRVSRGSSEEEINKSAGT